MSSLKSENGMASIGLIMIILTLLLFILYPLIQIGIEMNGLRRLNQEVQLISEGAVNDLVSTLSTSSLSEGHVVWKKEPKELYAEILVEKLSKLSLDVTPDQLMVNWNTASPHPSVEVDYQYTYDGVVAGFEKTIQVSFIYEIPIDN